MRVVVVGQGAREHALCSSLIRHHEVICTPGNPGIASICEIDSRPPEEIDADLYVIGPEVPLVQGLADRLRSEAKVVFGPGADGAALEGSKATMKEVLRSARVPTADFAAFTDFAEAEAYLLTKSPPYVIKTDGLAAGKGVKVVADLAEALMDVRQKLSGSSFGDAGRRVVIEDHMAGPEVSLLVVTDGITAVPLPVATDFKRVWNDDLGSNTGGMGAHSPVPWADQSVIDEVMQQIIEPTLIELRRRGIDYRGVLYAGLMITESGPKIVEYNVRFGDPEAQVVIPRLASDLGELLLQAALGRIEQVPEIDDRAALAVVMASRGYPELPESGHEITGIDRAEALPGISVFQAGTTRSPGGSLLTSGGRVLTVSALAPTLAEARLSAYRAVSLIEFEGAHYRTDIGSAAIAGSGAERRSGR